MYTLRNIHTNSHMQELAYTLTLILTLTLTQADTHLHTNTCSHTHTRTHTSHHPNIIMKKNCPYLINSNSPHFSINADEAAQAVEPSALIPFKFNPHRVVMVGDPCQLSATVFSRLAKDANYGQSLFQV